MGKVLLGFWVLWLIFLIVTGYPAPSLLGALTAGTAVYVIDLISMRRK